MAIDIQINPDSSQNKTTKPGEKQASISLNIRKSLDGNLMIFDHEEIDIVIMPSKNKIVAFAKDELSDTTYAAQDRLFYDLSKKGIIQPETVHAGSVYGSMEATISQSYDNSVDPIEMSVFLVGKFIKEEEPYFSLYRKQKEDSTSSLTDPDDEESTDLGDVPHEEEKGSLRHGWLRGPYGMSSFYRT